MESRVLHVAQPVEAGVAVVTVSLARYQAELGANVHVASPGGWLQQQLDGTSVTHHTWPARRNPSVGIVREVSALRSIVSAARPDVVVLHSAKAGLGGRLLLRGRVPTVFVPHAWSFEAVGGAMGLASTMWERHAARWTRTLVCLSDAEAQVGRDHGVRVANTVIIPNGVDARRFAPASRAAARRLLGLGDEPLAVCLGRLSRQKGQDRLVAAWPMVRERVPSAQLALVGDGPGEESLRRRAGAGITLAGPTQTPATWYQAADVVVAPSRWEGMALVPLEAMSCARSVVTVDFGGMAELLTGAGACLPVDASDEVLAVAVAVRLIDRGLADSEGRRGRSQVVDTADVATSNRRMHQAVVQSVRHRATPRHGDQPPT